jgi:aldose 1-epimerase
MTYQIEEFGILKDGRKADKITLANNRGISISFTNFGLNILSIVIPDNNGVPTDIVLGYDCIQGYETNNPMFGATVGRVINRISNACFTLNDRTYVLVRNRGKNNIHSDKEHGFHKVLWDYEIFGESAVRFHYLSPDGENGFPGSVDMYITYSLTENDSLIASYLGDPDEDTLLNPSNHCYFNLSGHKTGNMDDMEFRICADHFTPTDDEVIPTGEIRSVAETALDLRQWKTFPDMMRTDDPQISQNGGFDHNFVLNNGQYGIRKAACARSEKTGIEMDIYTELPGLQFYTGHSLKQELGKEKMIYGPYAGFCMEPQYFPNSINTLQFEKPIFSSTNPYHANMIYLFRTNDTLKGAKAYGI